MLAPTGQVRSSGVKNFSGLFQGIEAFHQVGDNPRLIDSQDSFSQGGTFIDVMNPFTLHVRFEIEIVFELLADKTAPMPVTVDITRPGGVIVAGVGFDVAKTPIPSAIPGGSFEPVFYTVFISAE